MYDFLRRPAWIVSHVLIGLLIVAMVVLGFWQRQRWIDESAKSDRLEAAATGTPVPLDDVVDGGTTPIDVPESVDYRRVTVTGTYDAAAEVLIRNRSQGGAPGAWVMTPLVQADGTAVPVVRGWVPISQETLLDPPAPPFPDVEPPSGEVTVTGVVQRTQEKGLFGAADPADGTLRTLARVDVARFGQQVSVPVEPVYVVLDGQDPPQPGGADALPKPVVLDVPEPTTNFSYMVQWWIFALIAIIGYPLVLRRVARNRARGEQVPVDDDPTGGGSTDGDRPDDRPVPTGV
jgi:cytochrome oxidase assembly protein ShyY1